MFRQVLKKTGLSQLFLAAAIALPLVGGVATPPVMAQQTDAELMAAANSTFFAYVRTGNSSVDRITEAGLRGLGRFMQQKTAVVNTPLTAGGTRPLPAAPVQPKAIDLERDDLTLYPIIYWAVDPAQPTFSANAIRKLNEYMRNGGMLFIDTRDVATNNRGKAALRSAVDAGLMIPRLIKVQPCPPANATPQNVPVVNQCHTLARSFYLLRDFDGLGENGQVWIENAGSLRHDGVATVIVGGLEWAAAWAVDAEGRYMMPVTGSNPQQREFAFRFGVNLVMYALTGSYKDDQVHAPEVLRRMSPQR